VSQVLLRRLGGSRLLTHPLTLHLCLASPVKIEDFFVFSSISLGPGVSRCQCGWWGAGVFVFFSPEFLLILPPNFELADLMPLPRRSVQFLFVPLVMAVIFRRAGLDLTPRMIPCDTGGLTPRDIFTLNHCLDLVRLGLPLSAGLGMRMRGSAPSEKPAFGRLGSPSLVARCTGTATRCFAVVR